MALVRDDILIPTKDEPGLGYIRESSSKQYVPDVFYKVIGLRCSNVTLICMKISLASCM